ncbi:MAG: NADH-quinone oxidoreductase subunit M [Gammaproteobacteria bacterium]|nr:NADH-quinone oxidoreductase subunit M [Gammaproteobacteria bacterium]MDH5734783.1 NADH-quinone oxidoreductase subunit M [Gammaproteobacteria bacterium]
MVITELHWTTQSNFPVLASLQIFPLAIAILLFLINDKRKLFLLAVISGIIELGLAVKLYLLYDAHNIALQFAEKVVLFSPLQYHAAIDGISVLFILLTAILNLIIILYCFVIPIKQRKSFIILLHVVIFSLISQYTTVDMFWFVITSSLQLLILGYILWNWATSHERDLALSRYLQFMSTGLFLLLLGVIMLGWNYSDATGYWSFDLIDLLTHPVDIKIQSIIFFLLFYGLAIRMPIFPLHGWLPIVAEHGTVTVAPVLLLGLKVGAYGLIRFVFPLLPEAVIQWHQFAMAFAVTGIFYAALLALMQVNLRRLLAFAVVSHTSILIIGLFSLNHAAFQGGIMLSINFGLAITGLLFTTGFIYWRTHTMLLSKLGGLFDHFPIIAITFFISGIAIIGMPGTPGFDSVHLVLEASFERFGALVTVAAAIGNVIAAGFLLWAFQKAFLSPKDVSELWSSKAIKPVTIPERLLALILLGLLLTVGFYPEPWLELIEYSLKDLSELYGHMETN